MRIRVSDKNVGLCEIESVNDLGKHEEYTIKSLCMLQMACMNRGKDPEKFKRFIGVLKEAIKQASMIYSEEFNNESDAFEQF